MNPAAAEVSRPKLALHRPNEASAIPFGPLPVLACDALPLHMLEFVFIPVAAVPRRSVHLGMCKLAQCPSAGQRFLEDVQRVMVTDQSRG